MKQILFAVWPRDFLGRSIQSNPSLSHLIQGRLNPHLTCFVLQLVHDLDARFLLVG